MEVPVLKQGDIQIVSLQSGLTDMDLVRLRDTLIDRVGTFHSRGVILDVSALDVMDSFTTRTLRSLALTVKLRGARMIIVGIQPEVAFSMVQLGLSLEGVETALDLEEGLLALRGPIAGSP
jgi:rsbT antagonist protein RsbS